jgi:galactose mutarotase-like enzyme
MAVGGFVAGQVNVLIQAGPCSATVLPAFGAKIASLRFHDRELLQSPLAPIAPRTHTMSFDQSDASGWDECLPSVAPCTVETAAGPAELPDHGDLWRVPWTTLTQGTDSVTVAGRCFSLPLTLQRTLSLAETGSGARLTLTYLLTNTGNIPTPWSWAAHPLFAVDPGDRIVLPGGISSLRVEGSAGNRLGRNGDTASWPMATLAGGGATDLRLAQSPESAIGDKLFAGPLGADENWCALERPAAGVRIRFTFDIAIMPWLGLWICYGGWPDRPGPKQNCVALEPATAPVDSLAGSGEWAQTLAPDQSRAWSMHVDFEPL